ncbi:MAG: efflux RND transporter permease subunit [Myxococcota bacterium]
MSGPIAWFARNHVAANLLMILIVFGGIAALPAINQKSFPDIQTEVIQIGVPFLGATPEEVEESVCVRVEEEIQGIEGIEKIRSTAAEGNCGVSAELLEGYPVDRALSEIKNAVDAIDTFPEDTEKPVVSHLTVRRNAMQIALSGDASERALKEIGERVRDEISSLPDVTQVELASVRPYEISIEVSEETLRRHGLTFDQVVAAVRRGSLDRPGGSIRTESGEVRLRTVGQAYRGEEFEQLVVLTREDGTRLLLGEIASVRDGFEEDPSYARFDGRRAVLIKVFRVGEQKVLDLVERVKEYTGEATARLPESLAVTVWRDGSQVLRDRLDILIRNGRGGFILVFLLLALFLRLRLAFWVAIGVPIAFLGALALFPMIGISIDVISLFAFILVLGLLVDDAIVVGENVHRHQEQGEDPLQSAIRGAQEVAIPVVFGVLTTVAAFFPLIVSPGPMGQIFGAIGMVVILCLFFSLVESQLVLPAHLGHMRIGPRHLEAEPTGDGVKARWQRFQSRMSGSLERLASDVYRPVLTRALEWRYATLALGIAIFVVTISVVGSGRLKFSFFPAVEADYVTARLTMPDGTPEEVTAAAIEQIEQAAWRLKRELDAAHEEEQILHVLASVGQQPSVSNGPPSLSRAGGGGSHLGEVSLELRSGDARPISAKSVEDRWRALSPPVPGAEELTFSSALFSVGDPIDVRLQSSDVDMLLVAAERMKEKLRTYPGVFDVNDSFREGKEEIRLDILPAAESLGLTLEDLSRQVRQAFYGAEAQRIQRGRDDVRVMVRYPESQRRSLADLDNLRIRTADGGEVPFYAVARAERTRGYANIKRADRQRVINVTAKLDETVTTSNEVLRALRAEFIPRLLADFPGLSYDLEGEQREQQKTMGALIRNFGFALVVIYALLAIPLRSYFQPLIIMAVIPFGLVGAIAGHLLMGMNLSMMSVFGVVALTGVVVNASLVLVHYVNTRREAGDPLEVAVHNAGVARFRPIVLTSLTTFAGLTPLLFERSVSAAFLIPMATSLAFGVAFATVISLFLVPSAYLVLEDLNPRARRRTLTPVSDTGDGTPPRIAARS